MILRRRAKLVWFIPAVAALWAAAPAWAEAEGRFDRTLSVSGAVDLDVETGSGNITVRPGQSGKVEIHGKIRANNGLWSGRRVEEKIHEIEANPPIQQEGNTIRIGHVTDRDLFRHISISYELIVPAETRLRSQSGSGDQSVDGIAGPVEATIGSGGLRISNLGGEVRARTGSGDVELNSVHGSAHVSAGSGAIQATGIAGSLVASTGSGNVKLEQTAGGDVEVETGSGDVELSRVKGAVRVTTGSGTILAEGEPTGHWRLHTGSGNVSIRLPAEAAFDLSAHTSSGTIESSHEVAVQGIISPKELHGKVRGGGNLVDLSTSSGSIEIK